MDAILYELTQHTTLLSNIHSCSSLSFDFPLSNIKTVQHSQHLNRGERNHVFIQELMITTSSSDFFYRTSEPLLAMQQSINANVITQKGSLVSKAGLSVDVSVKCCLCLIAHFGISCPLVPKLKFCFLMTLQTRIIFTPVHGILKRFKSVCVRVKHRAHTRLKASTNMSASAIFR